MNSSKFNNQLPLSPNSYAPGSGFERPNFGCVSPANGREREGIKDDQEAVGCDNSVCR
jgi:hypothetical protein